jgi:hypothetical protein
MNDPYAEIKAHFADVDGVTVSTGRGAQGLKLGRKMFAMFYKGQLLVTLSPQRVRELVVSGQGQPFDPGTGKAMSNRVLIPDSQRPKWIDYCHESRQYVATG